MMNLSIGQLDLAKPRNEGYDNVYCFMATGYRRSSPRLCSWDDMGWDVGWSNSHGHIQFKQKMRDMLQCERCTTPCLASCSSHHFLGGRRTRRCSIFSSVWSPEAQLLGLTVFAPSWVKWPKAQASASISGCLGMSSGTPADFWQKLGFKWCFKVHQV